VAVLTIIAFIPALGAEFVAWDDPANFLQNPHYAVNAVLLYFISRRLLLRFATPDTLDARTLDVASAFAALLFAIHPLRVESVAWITGGQSRMSSVHRPGGGPMTSGSDADPNAP
jgi:hypothetical protein